MAWANTHCFFLAGLFGCLLLVDAAQADCGQSPAPDMDFTFQPIGIIRSCFTDRFGIPRQPRLVTAARARLDLLPGFDREEAFAGITGFSHVWLLFVLHGVHHLQPQIKTRLVMPPALTIPLAFPIYGMFYLFWESVLGAQHWLNPAFSGFIVGYVIYDSLHYATHHFPLRWRYLKTLKRHHMLHHFKTPHQRFGVTLPLWDIVFRTKPA